jgi:hypothetical protein
MEALNLVGGCLFSAWKNFENRSGRLGWEFRSRFSNPWGDGSTIAQRQTKIASRKTVDCRKRSHGRLELICKGVKLQVQVYFDRLAACRPVPRLWIVQGVLPGEDYCNESGDRPLFGPCDTMNFFFGAVPTYENVAQRQRHMCTSD